MADRKSAGLILSLTLALAMLLGLGSLAPVFAQSNFSTGAKPEAADAAAPLDYPAWEKFASAADKLIGDPTSSDIRLETLRSEIASWRDKCCALDDNQIAN
jgi:potassium-dependent mechanosensitive channel